MTARLRLFLVRHGQAPSNRELRFLGRSDESLTEAGVREADALASTLSRVGLAAVYTSPLRRARQTAAPIALRCSLEPVVDERLRELDFGLWEGATRAEVLARGPNEAARLRRWERDPAAAPPGGESMTDLTERVGALIDELADRHAGGSVALVSHVGPIKAVLARVLEADLGLRMFLDSGTVTVVDWGRRPLVRLFNAAGDLDWRRLDRVQPKLD